MTLPHDLAAALAAGAGNRLSLPEYRQIELYSKRKTLAFAEAGGAPALPLAEVAGLCRAFLLLDAVLGPHSPDDERPASWQRYRDLPRAGATERLVAELYRLLRLVRIAAFHPRGEVGMRGGLVRIKAIAGAVVLTLEISLAGLGLLESAVAWYLGSLGQPYPDAYVEAMLAQYFYDIIAEMRAFSDEGRAPYQFRRTFAFNRHFRFDCDNPRTRQDDTALAIEIGAPYRDAARYPIDFFLLHGDALHIVPVEALSEGRLPLAELPRWRARLADGVTLPAAFRARFGHEAAAVNQPMT